MCNSSKKHGGGFCSLAVHFANLLYNIRTAQSPHSSYDTPECGITIVYTTQRATCDDAKQYPASYAICQEDSDQRIS